MKNIYIPISLILTVIGVFFAQRPASASAPPPSLVITQLQTGFTDALGHYDPYNEFVEIINSSALGIDTDHTWQIEYLSAANDGSKGPTSVLKDIGGYLPSGGHILLNHGGYQLPKPDLYFGVYDNSANGFFAKTGGHVRIIAGANQIDCISWGNAVNIPGCLKVTGTAKPGETIQRQPNLTGLFSIDTQPEYLPLRPQIGRDLFMPNDTGAGDLTPPVVLDGSDGLPPVEQLCSGVEISEVLANPGGSDVGHEFVELHNSTGQPINLGACGIKTNGKTYNFEATDSLAVNEYKAYYDGQTGLTLLNGGGTVEITPAGAEKVVYPALADDQAYSLVSGSWQITGLATPGASNQASLAEPLTGSNMVDITICAVGKFRNPETGRCKNLPAVSTAPKACAADQERNVQTGRCRKITVVGSTQKPCTAEQERSPQTGRCRKKAVATTMKTKKDQDPPAKTKPSYWIMLTVASAIVGYGAYEYRHDITHQLGKLNFWSASQDPAE